MKFEYFTAIIFWDYKRRDNVDYNFKIITALCDACNLNEGEQKTLLFKPIYLIISSIIECTMYDFLKRIQQHTNEKIPKIKDEQINKLKTKKIPDLFRSYIEIFKKHKILDNSGVKYTDLFEIVEIRNRIHIQNIKKNKSIDEINIWTIENIKKCGNVLKSLYELLYKEYPRPLSEQKINMDNFPEPWKDL